ncbi:hypothetical protein JTE90_022618 [Oedothorax gibbosus]|uniref:Uncharacterized protein n=1 Tax=Oedothorax gibbosus TaxID=931172 RepID=A0AAV6TTI6_9ARAC|nr:hypothetical protein JTE90_022618 [Oedothorax gibbosus]
MENLIIYENTIKRHAAKPVTRVCFDPKSVRVTYDDGSEYTMKFDSSLRLFLGILQNVDVKRTSMAPDVIWIPLGHFLLLGWSTGDCIRCERGELKLVIGFS